MSEPIAAVVDTNVILDIYSLTDILLANEESDLRRHNFRLTRARDSLLLAWCFHATRSTTLSLGRETTRLVKQRNSPNVATLTGHHMQMSIYLQKERLLSQWNDLSFVEGLATGASCDDVLLAVAEQLKVPLITNEGFFSTAGKKRSKRMLPSKAQALGVHTVSPRDYWSTRQTESQAIAAIRTQFDESAVRFLIHHDNSDAASRAVILRRAFLEYVLTGDARSSSALNVHAPWLFS